MKTKRIVWQTAVAALVLTSAPLIAADFGSNKETRGQLSAKDYRFVADAARGSKQEAKLGELAKQKGASQSVRDFGQRMVADHSKAADELKQIVTTKGAMVPTELSRRENSEIERFEKLSGRDFDKEYAEHMVKDHKKDAKEFEAAAKDLSDPDLKSFAQKTLTTIQEHLRMAENMEASVK